MVFCPMACGKYCMHIQDKKNLEERKHIYFCLYNNVNIGVCTRHVQIVY